MSKKIWQRVIAVEIIIMAVVVVAMALPWGKYTYRVDGLRSSIGEIRGDSYYVDNNINSIDYFVYTPGMKLGFGTYRLTIEYETDTDRNFAFISSVSDRENEIQQMGRIDMDNLTLLADRNSISAEFFVHIPAKDYAVYTFFFGDGGLAIRSVTVERTAGGIFNGLLRVAVISTIVNLLLAFADRRKKGQIDDGSVQIFFILSGAVLFTSIPLLLNYMINGHDLQYHLLRIEGIKDGILAGDFPIKIQSNWLRGNGYATAVFYGDLFLYIPAILRICGFGVTQSYNIYVFLCNAATCAIAYFCFKGMTGKRKPAVVGAVLYTASLYRLMDIYVRSSVGEYSALTFLPLIAYGLWKIFYDDTEAAGYRRNWIIPVLGFTGIINTHILTCEMVGAFTILTCLILIKRTFQKKRFIMLVKVVVYTAVLNAGFLVPFIHYMYLGNFIITANPPKYIQQYGAYIGQMLAPTTTYNGLTVDLEKGMASELPLTTGLGLIMGGAALVYTFAMGYIREKKEKLAGIVFGVFTVLSIWMSSYLFPWDFIQNICPLFKKIVSTLQFPWRFLTIACLALAVCVVIALKHIDEAKKIYKYFAVSMVAVSMLQAGCLMGNIMNSYEPFFAYGENRLDSNFVVGAEYLPAGMLVETFSEQYAIPDEDITYVQNHRDNNYINCTIQNNGSKEEMVKFSIVYYKGYTATDQDTGERLEVFSHEGCLCVKVAPGYSGTVVIEFTGFAAWRFAAIVSSIAAVVMFIYIIGREEFFFNKLHWRKSKCRTTKR